MFFLTQRFFFAFRGSIKYFELAHPELGRSGDVKRTIFKSSLTNNFKKVLSATCIDSL